MDEGCDLMARMLRDGRLSEGGTHRHRRSPGVFATLDAGAATTVALYFMYDVKQADPSSGRLRRSPRRSSRNPGSESPRRPRGRESEGPEAAFLAALHAIRRGGKKIPVNLVLVAGARRRYDRHTSGRSSRIPM